MGRKWKFALLLVFKDGFATVHHIISTSLSLASPSSGWLVQSTRFKRQDGQKIFRFAKSQMSASTRLEKKILKKNEWYFLGTAVSSRGRGQLEG